MNEQLSRPRAATIIKEQLSDLEKVKSSINYNVPFDAAMKSSLDSLKRQEDELREELRAAELFESKSDLEIVLDGDQVSEPCHPG